MSNQNEKGSSSEPERMDIEDETQYKNDSNTNILSEEMDLLKLENSQINLKESEKQNSKNRNQQLQNQNSVFNDNYDKNIDNKDYKPLSSHCQNMDLNNIENNNNHQETRFNSENIEEINGVPYMDDPLSNPIEYSNELDDQIIINEISYSTNDAGDGTDQGYCEDTLKNE